MLLKIFLFINSPVICLSLGRILPKPIFKFAHLNLTCILRLTYLDQVLIKSNHGNKYSSIRNCEFDVFNIR